MRLMRLVRFGVVAGLAALAAMMPAVALGHADLESSTPASGATLGTAPTEVELIFGGELVPDGSGFTVTDAEGRTVGAGELDLAVAERNELRGPVTISRPGTFTVTWTSVAADGHRESGTFTFAYGSEVPDTALAAPAAWAVPALGSLLVLAAVAGVAHRAGRSAP